MKKLTLVTHENGKREILPLSLEPVTEVQDMLEQASQYESEMQIRLFDQHRFNGLANRVVQLEQRVQEMQGKQEELERRVTANRGDYDAHLGYGTAASAVATALFLGAIAYLIWGGWH